jgi:exo-beta-1,3-glucanase (GH17 family)
MFTNSSSIGKKSKYQYMKTVLVSSRIKNSFIFMVPMLIWSCKSQTMPKENILKYSNHITNTLQQDSTDLLGGVSNAVCYSGFRAGQHPDRGAGAINPSDEQILEDLKLISNSARFNIIRLYDSGVNSETVLKAISNNKINLKVMLGIWLSAELSNHKGCAWLKEPIPAETLAKNKIANMREMMNGIRLANEFPEIVIAVNVGNEALVDWNDHKVEVDTVISYVHTVKKSIHQKVTVADNYEWWAANGQKLAKELDFISIHIYPVWEGKDIGEAMSYSIENVMKVRKAIPDSKIVISEAGWATVASEFGLRASEEKQKQYYTQIMEWASKMNITTFFFEAFDEDWKGENGNSLGAEKHWGLFTIDRKPKKAVQ